MERITEIGMMRAVGGRRSFVSLMFLMETFLLSAAFGGAGVGIGSLVVAFLARLRLTSTNEMLQIFFGGEVFSPTITLDTLWTCILQLVVVTVLSVIYPVWVARKIRPLDAVSRD
ncbi:MAG: ABC transporter permease, partial [Candidatus Margulisiibacteriota bacterium]